MFTTALFVIAPSWKATQMSNSRDIETNYGLFKTTILQEMIEKTTDIQTNVDIF